MVVTKLDYAERYKLPIVWLDEVVFTKRTLPKLGYSNPRSPLQVDQNDLFVGFQTVIAAVSAERGVILIDSKDEITNIGRFYPFVKKLSAKMGCKAFALFLDQLGTHKMVKMKELYS